MRLRECPVMKWLKRLAVVLVVLVAVLAIVPFFVSLNDYIPRIEKEATARLGEPVKIGGLKVVGLPLPHLTMDGISVGKTGDLQVGKVTVTPELGSLLAETRVIRSIRIESLVLTQWAIDKIPVWTKADTAKPIPPGAAPAVVVQSIELDNALIKLGKVNLGPFDAHIRLNARGEPAHASLRTADGALRVEAKSEQSHYLIDASAKAWKLPAGPAILFDELLIKGVATLKDVKLNQVNARLYDGTINGNLQGGWQKGLQLKGNFSINQVELRNLVPLLAPGKKMSGRLSAKPVFSANAPVTSQLPNTLKLETPFSVRDGVLYGVDIEKAATSLIRRESAGETRFEQLSGHLAMERGTQRFTDLKIATGALAATGNVSISPKKELSGRVNAEVKAANLASAGVPLNVSGTVDSPMLLPTGATIGGAAVGTAILGPGLGTSVGAKVGGWAEGLFGKKEENK